jgi:hypothetical protein
VFLEFLTKILVHLWGIWEIFTSISTIWKKCRFPAVHSTEGAVESTGQTKPRIVTEFTEKWLEFHGKQYFYWEISFN